MLSIAAGRREFPVLAERANAAIRLEKLVEERTSELRRRGAALRVTFDKMEHGVLMFDRELKLAAWNRQVMELLELPQALLESETRYADYLHFLAERGESPGSVPADTQRVKESPGRAGASSSL